MVPSRFLEVNGFLWVCLMWKPTRSMLLAWVVPMTTLSYFEGGFPSPLTAGGTLATVVSESRVSRGSNNNIYTATRRQKRGETVQERCKLANLRPLLVAQGHLHLEARVHGPHVGHFLEATRGIGLMGERSFILMQSHMDPVTQSPLGPNLLNTGLSSDPLLKSLMCGLSGNYH